MFPNSGPNVMDIVRAVGEWQAAGRRTRSGAYGGPSGKFHKLTSRSKRISKNKRVVNKKFTRSAPVLNEDYEKVECSGYLDVAMVKNTKAHYCFNRYQSMNTI